MKNLFYALPLAALLFTACATDVAEQMQQDNTPQTVAPTAEEDLSLFPENDGSVRVSTKQALALRQLMVKFDAEKALKLGETQITDAQLAEIKAFVDENLQGATQYDTYRNIFEWIYKNMTYASTGDAYLDPYDVFKYKRCICQGYANLLKTMCITQQIPAFCVNGQLSTIGGHAWDYVYADGTWYVSDPTNNQEWKIDQYTSYQNILIPQRTDLNLFEDENFGYNFYEGQLNVSEIKKATASSLVVPYGTNGFRITSFHLTAQAPSGIKQLYIGANIETLGTEAEALANYLPDLQEAFVSADNKKISSYYGIVYKGKQTAPLFVPAAIRTIYFKAMKTIDKNTLYGLKEVEEIYVAEGTERIEAYAFELCTKLKFVYVPESVSYVDDEAIYRCNSQAQIVRVPTGIREVKK